MTRERLKELLPIIQEYAEGRTVQYFSERGCWVDCKNPSFLGDVKYRIKSESKYRPFRTQKECWDEMLKHQPFGWLKLKENEFCINIGEVSWKEGYGDIIITFYTSKPFSLYVNAAYRLYTFADGTPFGIKEE